VTLIALGAALGTAAATRAEEKAPIIIGQALAFTGWMVTYDGQPARSMEIGVDDVNKAGGVLGGRMLKIEKCDTKTDREQGAKCGQEIVQAGAKLGAFSCDYDMGGPAALQYAAAGIVGFSVCGSDPKIGVQGIGPTIFTMSTASNAQGYVIAEWGYKRKGWRNAYTLLDNTIEYDKSLCQGFQERWTEQADTKIVGKDVFKQDDPSIAAQITKLKATQPAPDVIMMCSYIPGGASALRQIRAAGIETPILTSESFAGEFWMSSIPGLRNYYTGTHGNIYDKNALTPEEKEFLDKYVARYKEWPASDHVYLGYSLIQAYVKALNLAGTDEPLAVVKALETFRDVPLLIGPTSFTHDTHIQVRRPFAFLEVQGDGHMHFIEKYAAEKPWDIKKLSGK
jgi:branched-chain amino acid transport system substrate-binding protein